MPKISEFFGIIILMYLKDNERRHGPHIHVRYNDQIAVFNFDGECLAGELPSKEQRHVKKWIKLRRKELKKNWEASITTGALEQIKPLKRK